MILQQGLRDIFIACLLAIILASLAGCGDTPLAPYRAGFLGRIVTITYTTVQEGTVVVENLDAGGQEIAVFDSDFNGVLAPGQAVAGLHVWIARSAIDEWYVVDLPGGRG